ncbi:MAG: hypothetical protein ACTHNP_11200 [Solirubrobacterales bacterium]
MSSRGAAKWVALALVGLAIAIGVAIAAANLTSQQIGIASESVSAGDALAPSLRTPEEREEQRGQEGRDKARNEKPEPAPAESTGREEEPLPEETPSPNEPTEQRSDDYGGESGDD